MRKQNTRQRKLRKRESKPRKVSLNKGCKYRVGLDGKWYPFL